MTKEEMAELINRENLREKLVNKATKDFPKDFSQVEDWVQRTLMAGFKKANEFNDTVGAMAYLMEKITFIALKDKERDAEKRKILKGLPHYKPSRDPMRHIDYRVDLERAIRRTVREQVLQAALWEIHFEKATWEEVLNDMPGKTYDAWRHNLRAANAELKKEMKRKGYRRS